MVSVVRDDVASLFHTRILQGQVALTPILGMQEDSTFDQVADIKSGNVYLLVGNAHRKTVPD